MPPPVDIAGTTTTGQNHITGLFTTVPLVVGMLITGPGIPAGTTITSIDGTSQVSISANATADGTNMLFFRAPGPPTPLDGIIIHPESGLTFPWAQFISEHGWVGDITLGIDSSRAVMVMQVLFNQDFGSVGSQVLGYAFKDPDTGKLRRQLPFRYPLIDWYYCCQIVRVEGIAFTGPVFGSSGPWPGYKVAHITLAFEPPKFVVMTDAQLDALGEGHGEWERFVEKRSTPAAQFLTPERATFRWEDAAPGDPTASRFTTSQPGFLEVNELLSWKWLRLLGFRGVLDANGSAVNVLNAVAKVNLTTFAGRPPMTLLMEAPEIEIITFPMGVRAPGGGPDMALQGVNITLNRRYFNPTPAPAATLAGHNVARHPMGGYWGIVDRDGKPLYATTEFADVFKCV